MRRTPLALGLALLPALLVLDVPDAGLSRADRFGLELQECAAANKEGPPAPCALFGKIKVVDRFPDVKIQIVEHFPDLKIRWVEHFPDKPGRWKAVQHFPDYKVQFVEHFADHKVKFVEHFEGCD